MGDAALQPSESNAIADREAFSREDVIRQVIAWMLEGQSTADIVEAAGEMFPAADIPAAFDAAAEHFRTVAKADGDVVRGWCLDSTRELYRKMVAMGDYPAALRALKQLADFTK